MFRLPQVAASTTGSASAISSTSPAGSAAGFKRRAWRPAASCLRPYRIPLPLPHRPQWSPLRPEPRQPGSRQPGAKRRSAAAAQVYRTWLFLMPLFHAEGPCGGFFSATGACSRSGLGAAAAVGGAGFLDATFMPNPLRAYFRLPGASATGAAAAAGLAPPPLLHAALHAESFGCGLDSAAERPRRPGRRLSPHPASSYRPSCPGPPLAWRHCRRRRPARPSRRPSPARARGLGPVQGRCRRVQNLPPRLTFDRSPRLTDSSSI